MLLYDSTVSYYFISYCMILVVAIILRVVTLRHKSLPWMVSLDVPLGHYL